MRRVPRRQSNARIFAVPLLLALLGLLGLVAGLLDDGWFDLLCWLGVGSAVAAVGWSLAVRRS